MPACSGSLTEVLHARQREYQQQHVIGAFLQHFVGENFFGWVLKMLALRSALSDTMRHHFPKPPPEDLQGRIEQLIETLQDDELNEACESVDVVRMLAENPNIVQADGDTVLIVHPENAGSLLANFEYACILQRVDNPRFTVWRGEQAVSVKRFLPHFLSEVRGDLTGVRTKQELLETYMLHFESFQSDMEALLLAFIVRTNGDVHPVLVKTAQPLADHEGPA